MANRIGTNGADNLVGTVANDFFDAKGGNDQVTGGKGGDFLDGGDGIDTAHYEASVQGVSINLFSGTASGGDAQGDRLVSIENVLGSTFADVLRGSEVNNLLRGGGGADQLDGGDGIDSADYATAKQRVDVSLLEATGFAGDATGDRYTGIENVTGSAFADDIEGDGGDNLLTGGKGADALLGSSGADTLKGGAGNDRLVGGAGADTLTDGAGADTFEYNSLIDSNGPVIPPDLIKDFQHGVDKIDLHAIDAQNQTAGNQDFSFINRQEFTAEGQVRFLFEGDHTVLELNTGGAINAAESEIQFAGHINLTASDLVL